MNPIIACAVSALVLNLALSGAALAKDFYVKGGAQAGDGSQAKPFGDFASIETASKAGDRIYVLAAAEPIKAHLALKENQKLIGKAAGGDAPVITSATTDPKSYMIKLAQGVEVSGLHFVNMANPALRGDNGYSGAHIHDNLFNGVVNTQTPGARGGANFKAGDAIGAPGLIYSIELDANQGDITGVVIDNNSFRDGDSLGSIMVIQKGSSTGAYRMVKNHANNLGGRLYFIQTVEQAKVTTALLDSDANNIGVGNKNSDSIIPYMMGSSQQTMLVKNFHYKNDHQEGNGSNTGLEVFMYGPPRPEADRVNYCVACKLKLDIEDSVFENSVTDGIQLTNSGSDSVMDVAIRRTKITGAHPKQVGGAVSLVAEEAKNSGSHSNILIEYSELSGSTAYGFANEDKGPTGFTATVDLGGGALGSKGHNRIVGNAQGSLKIQKEHVVAKNNWWGGAAPKVTLTDPGGTADTEPTLAKDPG